MSWFSGLFSKKYSSDKCPRMKMGEYSKLCLAIGKSVEEDSGNWEVILTDFSMFSEKYKIVDKEKGLEYIMSTFWCYGYLKSGACVRRIPICALLCESPAYVFEEKEAEHLYEKFSKLYNLRLEESKKKTKEECNSLMNESEKALMEKYVRPEG